MKKFKLHVLFEHSGNRRPHGCSYIRLLLPLNHPTLFDTFIVSQGATYQSADVIVVERTWFPNISLRDAQKLVRQIRRDGASFVYSIDDNLLDLTSNGFNGSPFSTETLMVLRYFAREADGIIVTTEFLKDRLTRLNRNIFVVPNALDERLWGLESAFEEFVSDDRKRLVLGYMGTHTHDGDLMMILQPLREILRKNPDRFELQFIGGAADRSVMDAFAGLPVSVLDVGKNVEYPAFVRWMVENVKWDFALAPLEDSIFTRCKSDIKHLDYGAMGIAGIYSNGPVYGGTIRHLETGFLSDNTTDSWKQGLDVLLNNNALRREMGRKAREYTSSMRSLRRCAANWRDAVFSVVSRRGSIQENESAAEFAMDVSDD